MSWFSPTNGGLLNSNIKHLQGHWIILALSQIAGRVGFIITRNPTQKINLPAYLIDPPKMLMKLTGRFSGFQVGLAWLFFGPLGIFLFLGLLLFLCYFLWHWHYCQISFKFENLTKSPNLNIYDTLSLVKFYLSSNLTFKTNAHPWCDSHSTSISSCEV